MNVGILVGWGMGVSLGVTTITVGGGVWAVVGSWVMPGVSAGVKGAGVAVLVTTPTSRTRPQPGARPSANIINTHRVHLSLFIVISLSG
ncbi:MAG: hypothetical protein P8Z30_13320 [Acidobacteriota bacterium]